VNEETATLIGLAQGGAHYTYFVSICGGGKRWLAENYLEAGAIGSIGARGIKPEALPDGDLAHRRRLSLPCKRHPKTRLKPSFLAAFPLFAQV